jgi:hypothetical protein
MSWNGSGTDWTQLSRHDASEPQLGAFAVVEARSTIGHTIAAVTRSKYGHALIYVGAGQIVEGWWPKTRQRPASDYAGTPMLWSDLNNYRLADDTEAAAAANYALSFVGHWYGALSYLDFLTNLLPWEPIHARHGLGIQSQPVCSTLVALDYQNTVTSRNLLADCTATERRQGLWTLQRQYTWSEISPAILARLLGEQRRWMPEPKQPQPPAS